MVGRVGRRLERELAEAQKALAELDEVIGKLATGSSPEAFALDEKRRRIYVSNEEGSSLSIIDIAHSHQPLRWGPPAEPDRYVLVFNGEIYNYLELREDLEQRGLVRREADPADGRGAFAGLGGGEVGGVVRRAPPRIHRPISWPCAGLDSQKSPNAPLPQREKL